MNYRLVCAFAAILAVLLCQPGRSVETAESLGGQYAQAQRAKPMRAERLDAHKPDREEAQEEAHAWTSEERALLAAVISAEARGESYEGQLAVACVALNRLENGRWGNTLEEVLTAPYQFAKPHWQYGESEMQAAEEVLQGARPLPASVYFFQMKKLDKWYGAAWYTTIGCHNFYIE